MDQLRVGVVLVALALGLLAVSPAGARAGGTARFVDGYAYVAPDAPVEHARLRLLTPAGRTIPGIGYSGSNGTFVVQAPRLPARFVIETVGGMVNGLLLPGALRALVVNYHGRRFVHVGPATTLALAVGRLHPHRRPEVSTRLVKRYFGLSPRSTLGETPRWDRTRFDGLAFLRAAGRAGGLNAYVRRTAALIDRHPAARHVYLRGVPLADTLAGTTPASTSAGGTVINGVLSGVGAAVAKALIGDALTGAGLSNVANFLGLGNQSEQLEGLSQQLTTLNVQLGQLQGAVSQIQDGVAVVENLQLASFYTSLTDSPSLSAVTDVGTGNDQALSDITHATSFAQDIADATTALPSAAQADPLTWCKDNASSFQFMYGGLTTNGVECSIITSDYGTGAEVAGAPMSGNPYTWCNQNEIALQAAAPLAAYSCQALIDVQAYAAQTNLAYFGNVAGTVLGSNGGVALVDAYDRLKQSTLGTSATAPVYLTAANFSVYQDNIVDRWASVIALLGLYASVNDAALKGNLPGNCQLPAQAGAPGPSSSLQTNVLPADCDVRVAGLLAQSVYADPAPASPASTNPTRPDIPDGAVVAISSQAALTDGTATVSEWFLPSGASSTCPASAAHLSTVVMFGQAQAFANILPDGTTAAACQASPDDLFTFDNPASGDPTGWGVPSISDLQGLTATVGDPGAALHSVGLPDLSGNATYPLPLPDATYSDYPPSTNLASPVQTNTGTAYGIWSSSCSSENWLTGYFFNDDQQGFEAIRIAGTWCSYLDLATGSVHAECVAATGPYPCSAPTTNSSTVPTDGPVDFGHPATLMLERTPTPGEYWRLGPIGPTSG
jgi:hypothetical protein